MTCSSLIRQFSAPVKTIQKLTAIFLKHRHWNGEIPTLEQLEQSPSLDPSPQSGSIELDATDILATSAPLPLPDDDEVVMRRERREGENAKSVWISTLAVS